MYNPKFDSQSEELRRDMGFDGVELIGRPSFSRRRSMNYTLPLGVKLFRCVQDVNGEWVPVSDSGLGELEN